MLIGQLWLLNDVIVISGINVYIFMTSQFKCVILCMCANFIILMVLYLFSLYSRFD